MGQCSPSADDIKDASSGFRHGSHEIAAFRERKSENGLPGVTKSQSDGSSPSTRLVLISDPGQDLDDEMAFVMLRYLVEMGKADVLGIIATLSPAFHRARLCRGTLDTLGLYGVPIGVGSDGGDTKGVHKASTFIEWARPYMPPRFSEASASFEPGNRLLHRLFKTAMPYSITLVVIASLKDAALFLRDDEELFKSKIKEVVIMGGVEPWKDDELKPVLLQPDTAHNNMFDKDAADYFYKRCQELGVPLIIVSRWCAYAAKVPRLLYDELASMGSWIGCRLRNAQRNSIEALWTRAASPPGSDARQGLPPRCDKAWFLKTFCNDCDDPGRGPDDTVWDLVVDFMQYDTIAVLAALPELRAEYFKPCGIQGPHGIEHLVIGRTEQDHNVVNANLLGEMLRGGFRKGLTYNLTVKVQIILISQPKWHKRYEDQLVCFALRALIELDILDCAGIVLSSGPDEVLDPLQPEDIKETLAELGLMHVPVLVRGEDGKGVKDHLMKLYKKASPAGVCLVCTGCCSELSDFVECHEKIFYRKTRGIVLLGGGYASPEFNSNDKPTGDMVIAPDPAATNNLLDLEGCKQFFQHAQRLLVPMVILSRYACGGAALPRAFFDLLGKHGGRLGIKCQEIMVDCITTLWLRACSTDAKVRGSLPDRCDRSWFVKTFCAGREPNDNNVWPSVSTFNAYNTLTLLMALPPVLKALMHDITFTVRATKHRIVGLTSEENGIKDKVGLRKLLLQLLFAGTQLNAVFFHQNRPPPISVDGEDGSEDGTWEYDASGEALSWLLPASRLPSGSKSWW